MKIHCIHRCSRRLIEMLSPFIMAKLELQLFFTLRMLSDCSSIIFSTRSLSMGAGGAGGPCSTSFAFFFGGPPLMI